MADITDKDIESAILDSSTGLYNSPYFMRRLRMMISCSRRHKFPLGIILINFNVYGESGRSLSHEEQNFVLNTIGRVIGGSVRWDSDLACSIEENKIGIILPYCKKEEAGIVINRVLNNLKQDDLLIKDGSRLFLSLKIGSSSLDLSHDALSFLKEAEDNANIIETI
ncbi:MAG: GGDEF domain-containing protein [Nitrospinae bacterium]|nr:GGDEF domain-containing protein [Nitrospinota bacterium]MBI3813361.1 GGDEF domain-containing protein [Nitrospinota bacterium]